MATFSDTTPPLSGTTLRPAAEPWPMLPWGLGLAGLIPFWGLALALVTGRTFGIAHDDVSVALAGYAATIASFLGGMRWGLAVREPSGRGRPFDYVVSVVPQLLAWVALALPDPARLVALGVLILATGPLDYAMVPRGAAPAWFGWLRLVLSVAAAAALLIAAVG